MTDRQDISIGIDFGTTNTVVAVAGPDGDVKALTFRHANETLKIFQSALCFWEERSGAALHLQSAGGPWAIEKFLEASLPHRFLQSFKTFAASKAFQETRIFRQRFAFEDILAAFLHSLMEHAGEQFPKARKSVVIGRPVRFAGAAPDEALAMQRYETAFAQAGITDAHYVHEPVGAAFFFARKLTEAATVLVADFGGGTSDFSVMRFEHGAGQAARVLGRSGIGIAGDAFDYRIIDHVVSPRLGKGADYWSFDKLLTMPNVYYANFARWHQLALMKSTGELKELKKLMRDAVDPGPIEELIAIIENDLGFALYRAVTETKITLSTQPQADFRFHQEGIAIAETVTREDFESWIAEDVERIAATVEDALRDASLAADAIDKVFLTGGSSFIPAIRKIFVERFGEDKLVTGDQFESIAYGLALIGQSDTPAIWSAST